MFRGLTIPRPVYCKVFELLEKNLPRTSPDKRVWLRGWWSQPCHTQGRLTGPMAGATKAGQMKLISWHILYSMKRNFYIPRILIQCSLQLDQPPGIVRLYFQLTLWVYVFAADSSLSHSRTGPCVQNGAFNFWKKTSTRRKSTPSHACRPIGSHVGCASLWDQNDRATCGGTDLGQHIIYFTHIVLLWGEIKTTNPTPTALLQKKWPTKWNIP